jgi:hypothetical protein
MTTLNQDLADSEDKNAAYEAGQLLMKKKILTML